MNEAEIHLMTDPILPADPASNLVAESSAALRRGDKLAARRFAKQALQVDPSIEKAWLILAATASPSASIYYLQRALAINPQSASARKGLVWAQKRLQATPVPAAPARAKRKSPKQLTRGQFWLVLSFSIVFLFLSSTIFWLNRPLSQPAAQLDLPLEAIAADTTTTTVGAALGLPIPAAPHTITRLFLPITTSSEQPLVPGAVPTVDSQPAADEAQPASDTDYTVQGGDTLLKIAASYGVTVQEIATANKIASSSLIHVGQRIIIPASGSGIAVVSLKTQAKAQDQLQSGDEQSIVVDLSEQHMYAYEGDHLVYDFVVSTGRGGGTLTGTFKILDKDPNAWSDPWGFWMPDWMGDLLCRLQSGKRNSLSASFNEWAAHLGGRAGHAGLLRLCRFGPRRLGHPLCLGADWHPGNHSALIRGRTRKGDPHACCRKPV